MDGRAIRAAEAYQDFIVANVFSVWTPITLDYARPQPRESVLDVACGTGVVARNMAPLVGRDGRVVGLDLNPAMLAVARSLPAPQGAAIKWREGDASGLPDCCFDLVTCQQGLQFFPERAAAAREMHRVLTPGGRAVVSVWQGLEQHPVYLAIGQAMEPHLGLTAQQIMSPWSLGDAGVVRALFEAAGFQRVEITPRTAEVRFPSPKRFVELTVSGSAAVLPIFGQMDEAARAALVASVNQDVNGVLSRHIQGNMLAFPMSTHIVQAVA